LHSVGNSDDELIKHEEYTGTINCGDKRVAAAYAVYNEQKQRCTNPNHKKYEWWGARGIRVEYSAREFISWYLRERPKNLSDRVHCGRIDHDKNYSFSNIVMQTPTENSEEANHRTHGAHIVVLDKNLDVKFKFKTMKECAAFFAVSEDTIQQWCKPMRKFYHRKRHHDLIFTKVFV
jgi:hypothetical protein